MTLKQKALARARELGVEVIVSRDWQFPNAIAEVQLEAPDGYHFTGLGLHCAVTPGEPGESDNARGVWRSVLTDMAQGITPCTAETPCDDWSECDANPEQEGE